jgi:hypothetical protein
MYISITIINLTLMKLLKTLIAIILIAAIYSSCTTVKQIGSVNMLSTRNIDASTKYTLISSYAGGSDKEIKKSTCKTIEDAVNAAVKKIPGGEYLMNVKIYVVDDKYYATEGDVWGNPQTLSYRGFKVGDKVTWKNKNIISKAKGGSAYLTGIITSLKDDKTCFVMTDADDKIVELSYDDISKS